MGWIWQGLVLTGVAGCIGTALGLHHRPRGVTMLPFQPTTTPPPLRPPPPPSAPSAPLHPPPQVEMQRRDILRLQSAQQALVEAASQVRDSSLWPRPMQVESARSEPRTRAEPLLCRHRSQEKET
jgi:hypothetical protein